MFNWPFPGVTSAEKIAKEMSQDTEKASSLKEKFENGKIFRDDEGQAKSRDIHDEGLFSAGKLIIHIIIACISNSLPTFINILLL